MTKWTQKRASINRTISIHCETIEYVKSKSDFHKTLTGLVESINPGSLTLSSTDTIHQPLPDSGNLSFNDNGRLVMFRIIGVAERSGHSVTFVSLPEEEML